MEKKCTKIFIYLGLFLIISFFASPKVSHAATSVTQHGITWTFNGDYEVGQFVNGDYWVVDAGSGVSISNISPGYQYTTDPSYNSQPRHINGSMKNYCGNPQGFDSQRNYDVSKNVGIGITTETPLILVGGDSLLSSISNPNAGENVYESYVDIVAILTVVSSAPPANSFRPSWKGPKVLKNWSDVDMSVLSTKVYTEKPDPTAYINATVAPVTYFEGWQTRFITPMSMPSNYYWSNEKVVPMALMMHLDYTTEIKTQMAINMIQMGIDFFGHTQVGGKFTPDAGVNLGYKLPVVYAAVLLNDTEMLAALLKSGAYRFNGDYTTSTAAPADMAWFAEDSPFYVDQALIDQTNNPNWIGYCERTAKACLDIPYAQEMLGMPEWASQGFYGFTSSTASWGAAYRTIANGGGGSFPGISMAMRLLAGGVTAWNNPALFDYVDRYMAISNGDPDPFGYVVHGEVAGNRPGGLIGYMYNTYRADYQNQPTFRADVDGSSQINTTDALLTLRSSLGLSMTGTSWQASATTGDVNCDGVSNSTDALLILRHSLGLSMSATGWCE